MLTRSIVTCISCHMQVRTCMVVDPRHDHSFRVPRPDLFITNKVHHVTTINRVAEDLGARIIQ